MTSPCLDPKALAGELSIQFAAEHRGTLLAMLEDAAEDLHLDLSGIDTCDSSGVQLLLALRRSLADRQRALVLLQPSAAVRQVLDTFGLQALMQPPVPAAEAATPSHDQEPADA